MKTAVPSGVGLAAVLLLCVGSASGASISTGFTYQGQLADADGPVTDTCDFQFSLWDAASSGNQLGSTLPVTKAIEAGLFTVELDFGDQFDGGDRWLQIAVCCPSSCAPETLDARQKLTPTPYSVNSLNSLNADKVDGSHGCSLVKATGYSDTGDFETLSPTPLCGGLPKGCTIRLISTKSYSSTSTADDGEAFGFYNQNWFDTEGGWRVVAMTSSSASVYTAAGVNGDTTPVTIMSAGSCELKDDTASASSYATWVVNDSSTIYMCFVYVCD